MNMCHNLSLVASKRSGTKSMEGRKAKESDGEEKEQNLFFSAPSLARNVENYTRRDFHLIGSKTSNKILRTIAHHFVVFPRFRSSSVCGSALQS